MKAISRPLVIAVLCIALMAAVTGVAYMAAGPGEPDLAIGTTVGSCTGTADVTFDLTGIAGDGAAGFTFIFGVDPASTISFNNTCAAGPAFANTPANGCFFFSCTVVDINDQGTGLNLFQLDGTCAAGSAPAIFGDQLAATVTVVQNAANPDLVYTIDGLPSDTAGTFTQVFDPDVVLYNIPDDGSIVDGSVRFCQPTAVGIASLTANPAAGALSLWPLLAGGAAVAAGAGFVLLRRKR